MVEVEAEAAVVAVDSSRYFVMKNVANNLISLVPMMNTRNRYEPNLTYYRLGENEENILQIH